MIDEFVLSSCQLRMSPLLVRSEGCCQLLACDNIVTWIVDDIILPRSTFLIGKTHIVHRIGLIFRHSAVSIVSLDDILFVLVLQSSDTLANIIDIQVQLRIYIVEGKYLLHLRLLCACTLIYVIDRETTITLHVVARRCLVSDITSTTTHDEVISIILRVHTLTCHAYITAFFQTHLIAKEYVSEPHSLAFPINVIFDSSELVAHLAECTYNIHSRECARCALLDICSRLELRFEGEHYAELVVYYTLQSA